MKPAATARTRGRWSGSSTWRSCSKSLRVKEFPAGVGLAGGFLAGANFLPAARPLVGLQHFLAQADGFRRDFHVFIVGDEFNRLLQAQLPVRDQADSFVGAGGA